MATAFFAAPDRLAASRDPAAKPTTKPAGQTARKSLLTRVIDRLIAAREASTRIEISRHRHSARFSPNAADLDQVFGRGN